MRKVTKQTVETYLLLASDLMKSHPDRFVGFDLVGQVRHIAKIMRIVFHRRTRYISYWIL